MKNTSLGNKDNYCIRKATEYDAEKIIDFFNIIGGETDFLLFGKDEFTVSILDEQIYLENFYKYNNGIILLAECNNEIIALGEIISDDNYRLAHNCEIGISVRKDYWGNKIASTILEELISYAKQNDIIKVLSLKVFANNLAAVKLYEKYNFKKIGTHKNYFHVNNEYYDCILMDLYL